MTALLGNEVLFERWAALHEALRGHDHFRDDRLAVRLDEDAERVLAVGTSEGPVPAARGAGAFAVVQMDLRPLDRRAVGVVDGAGEVALGPVLERIVVSCRGGGRDQEKGQGDEEESSHGHDPYLTCVVSGKMSAWAIGTCPFLFVKRFPVLFYLRAH
jgi:hypothetical protein